MKFINNEQFEQFFYNFDNRKMHLDETTIPMRARDIFSVLQQTYTGNQPFLFLVGPGKNGKLALELARLCAFAKIRIHLFLPQTYPSNRDIVNFFKDKMSFVQVYHDINESRLQALFDEKTLLIDGLFGTGIQSNLDTHYQDVVNQINNVVRGDVISLIIPSGMTNDSKIFIKATKVITVEYVLDTLLNTYFPIQNIICVKSQNQIIKYLPTTAITSCRFDSFSPTLTLQSHKYNRGMILSFGGFDYFGASILALKAMQKINACMIQHFSLDKHQLPLLSTLPEIVFKSITHSSLNSIHTYPTSPSVAVFGFGVKDTSRIEKHFSALMQLDSFCPFVLDAGALTLATHSTPHPLHPLILTPHHGEFAQLIDCSIEEVQKNKVTLARKFAKENNVILVLKSSLTIVTNGSETWVNPLSIPTLATPGSGDVLSGVLAAHIDHTTTAENLFTRVCMAVYHHSSAAASINAKNITASMLIEAL